MLDISVHCLVLDISVHCLVFEVSLIHRVIEGEGQEEIYSCDFFGGNSRPKGYCKEGKNSIKILCEQEREKQTDEVKKTATETKK